MLHNKSHCSAKAYKKTIQGEDGQAWIRTWLCSQTLAPSWSLHDFWTTSFLERPTQETGNWQGFCFLVIWSHLEGNREMRRERSREKVVEEEEMKASQRRGEDHGGYWYFITYLKKMVHLNPSLFQSGHWACGRDWGLSLLRQAHAVSRALHITIQLLHSCAIVAIGLTVLSYKLMCSTWIPSLPYTSNSISAPPSRSVSLR